jgi:acyl-CoA reductase-like NAD-dependent aldehyde dehydrogenase
MEESRAAAVKELRARFAAGQTRPAEWRAKQLRGVLRMATEMEAEICDALHADVGKPKTEAHVHEVGDARAASYPRNLLRSITPFSWFVKIGDFFARVFLFFW